MASPGGGSDAMKKHVDHVDSRITGLSTKIDAKMDGFMEDMRSLLLAEKPSRSAAANGHRTPSPSCEDNGDSQEPTANMRDKSAFPVSNEKQKDHKQEDRITPLAPLAPTPAAVKQQKDHQQKDTPPAQEDYLQEDQPPQTDLGIACSSQWTFQAMFFGSKPQDDATKEMPMGSSASSLSSTSTGKHLQAPEHLQENTAKVPELTHLHGAMLSSHQTLQQQIDTLNAELRQIQIERDKDKVHAAKMVITVANLGTTYTKLSASLVHSDRTISELSASHVHSAQAISELKAALAISVAECGSTCAELSASHERTARMLSELDVGFASELQKLTEGLTCEISTVTSNQEYLYKMLAAHQELDQQYLAGVLALQQQMAPTHASLADRSSSNIPPPPPDALIKTGHTYTDLRGTTRCTNCTQQKCGVFRTGKCPAARDKEHTSDLRSAALRALGRF